MCIRDSCKAIHEQTDVRVLMTGEISDELFGYKYTAVSYTHLDVYKRQGSARPAGSCRSCGRAGSTGSHGSCRPAGSAGRTGGAGSRLSLIHI